MGGSTAHCPVATSTTTTPISTTIIVPTKVCDSTRCMVEHCIAQPTAGLYLSFHGRLDRYRLSRRMMPSMLTWLAKDRVRLTTTLFTIFECVRPCEWCVASVLVLVDLVPKRAISELVPWSLSNSQELELENGHETSHETRYPAPQQQQPTT